MDAGWFRSWRDEHGQHFDLWETIDYGPCAFVETYDPATFFSSIDHGGRYAYGNQHRAALWNLARLAEACYRFS